MIAPTEVSMTRLILLLAFFGVGACDCNVAPLAHIVGPGSIAGRVCDPGEGKGIYGADVYVVAGKDNHRVGTLSDGDGNFLLQSVPTYSPTKIITLVKSLVAREVFKRCPHVKAKLWGGEFWSDGYFVSTVGPSGNENTIANYVRDQGQDDLGSTAYQQLHRQGHTPSNACP